MPQHEGKKNSWISPFIQIRTKSLWGLCWAKTHPSSKCNGNPFFSFCLSLLTNQQVDTGKKHKFLGGGSCIISGVNWEQTAKRQDKKQSQQTADVISNNSLNFVTCKHEQTRTKKGYNYRESPILLLTWRIKIKCSLQIHFDLELKW